VERSFSAPELGCSRRQFVEFEPAPGIVVLGEPGAGKSHVLRLLAERTPAGAYATVGRFLAVPSAQWRGKTLFLDALDEKRAHSGSGDEALDRLVAKLWELDRPPFRIACRAADWREIIDGSKAHDPPSRSAE
jgi:hypothetical protein